MQGNRDTPNALRRRQLLALAGALAAPGLVACVNSPSTPVVSLRPSLPSLPPLFDDIERRTFDFFWETANPENGLVPDRWPTVWAASIASVGFALTVYPVGVERGYITRAQARERVAATLRFLADAPQGPQAAGTAGHRGFFYHYLDMRSGLRLRQGEISTIDTALLLAGVLFCLSWFDQDDPTEGRIRHYAEALYARVEWTWMLPRSPLICMGWTPEHGFLRGDWSGYDEAMILYLLALGSPSHPIPAAAWNAHNLTYDRIWGHFQGYQYLGFAPLFGHQYSHLWVDYRGIADDYMRRHGMDYFENSRRATYAHQAYAVVNPGQWNGYDAQCWGLTACDGPATTIQSFRGHRRAFDGYAARGAGPTERFDDGTIAPTAALSSINFAPEIVIPTVEHLLARHGRHIYGEYGFFDAFNPSFRYDVPLACGRLVPGWGWVATDYLGIDQGPILGMIANYRNELVWKTMRRNAHLVTGLRRAGFAGGWLDT